MVTTAMQIEPQTMATMREHQADVTLFLITIFGLPALAASLMRSSDIGWNPAMGLHTGIYIIILLMTVQRRRLPAAFKSGMIILLLYIIGTSSFWTLLTAGSGPFFYIVAIVLAVLLFGFQAGLTTLLLCLLTMSASFLATRGGIIQPDIDFDKYAFSTSSWLTMIAVFTLLSSLTLGLMTIMDRWLNRFVEQMKNEIEERKNAEHRLEDSVAEKDTLLREVHHRVKSNLQVITSILDFQLSRTRDVDSARALRDSRNRIRIMSMIQEELYKSEDLSRINFPAFLKRLITSLHDFYPRNNGQITFNLDIDPVYLGIDTALPCGLIVNELVSNSLLHAFPDGRKGNIKVAFKLNGEENFKLMISDDGIGFPEKFDTRESITLGMKMVEALTEQLGARIQQNEGEGTSFTLNFREYFEAGTEMH